MRAASLLLIASGCASPSILLTPEPWAADQVGVVILSDAHGDPIGAPRVVPKGEALRFDPGVPRGTELSIELFAFGAVEGAEIAACKVERHGSGRLLEPGGGWSSGPIRLEGAGPIALARTATGSADLHSGCPPPPTACAGAVIRTHIFDVDAVAVSLAVIAEQEVLIATRQPRQGEDPQSPLLFYDHGAFSAIELPGHRWNADTVIFDHRGTVFGALNGDESTPPVLYQLDPQTRAVTQSATAGWALGEVSLAAGADGTPWAHNRERLMRLAAGSTVATPVAVPTSGEIVGFRAESPERMLMVAENRLFAFTAGVWRNELNGLMRVADDPVTHRNGDPRPALLADRGFMMVGQSANASRSSLVFLRNERNGTWTSTIGNPFDAASPFGFNEIHQLAALGHLRAIAVGATGTLAIWERGSWCNLKRVTDAVVEAVELAPSGIIFAVATGSTVRTELLEIELPP